MRNLTIWREKSSVGCLATLQVYIEDAEEGTLTINGTRCRKLGVLKNGDESTFTIDGAARRLYVIADKLSRNYSNEYYPLPVGTEDIRLQGKMHYDPMSGNAFRFDGNDSVEVQQHRKKGSKLGIVVCVVAVAVGLIVGKFIPDAIEKAEQKKPQVFESSGMQITLTKAFVEEDVHEYGLTAGYSSNNVQVLVLKERFSAVDGLADMTLEEYTQLVIEANQDFDMSEPKLIDGLTTMQYNTVLEDTGVECTYFIVAFKGPDAFWLFEFVAPAEDLQDLEQTFIDYAKSVKFE